MCQKSDNAPIIKYTSKDSIAEIISRAITSFFHIIMIVLIKKIRLIENNNF